MPSLKGRIGVRLLRWRSSCIRGRSAADCCWRKSQDGRHDRYSDRKCTLVYSVASFNGSDLSIVGPMGDRVVRRMWFICSQVDKPLNSLGSWLGDIFRWRTNERLSNLVAMSGYSPKPVAVPVIYFAAEYGSAAWRRISTGFETVKIGDDHVEVVRDHANLSEIANHLRTAVLNRYVVIEEMSFCGERRCVRQNRLASKK